jgi:hypothetical protein
VQFKRDHAAKSCHAELPPRFFGRFNHAKTSDLQESPSVQCFSGGSIGRGLKPTDASLHPAVHCSGHIDRRVWGASCRQPSSRRTENRFQRSPMQTIYGFPLKARCHRFASETASLARKSSNGVLSPRLEEKARCWVSDELF